MKIRKLISCALALILIFSALPVFTISQAEYWSWEIKKYSQKFGDWRIIPAMSTDDDDGRHINYKSYYIIDYYGNKTNVKVPSKVNGKKIVGLEEKVFAGKKIKSVVIPNTVYNIGTNVFKGIKTLKKVTLPDSVKRISPEAFKGCTALTTVNASGITHIYEYAFAGCKKLKNIPLKKIKDFGYAAFKGCSSLTTANLAISEVVSRNVFENCTNLKSVHLSKKTRYIGPAVFKGCKSLEKISVDEQNNIYSIYDGALTRNNKSEIVAYPAARADNDFVIPSETKVVNSYAFYGAKKLKADLTFSNKIKQIGVGAFENCLLIEKISLPDTVKTISKHAFRNTAFMKAQKGNSAYYVDNILIRMSNVKGEYTLKDSTVFIANHALDDCEVDTLIIPESVTKFNQYSLLGNGTVDTLIINSPAEVFDDINFDSVYSMGDKPKESQIKNVIVNSPIDKLGITFCHSTVENVTLPDTVTTISSLAFSYCKNLKSIDLPDNVTTLGNGCFDYSSLESIKIPQSVTTIQDYAFAGTNLKKIVLPDTVTSIGKYLFKDCKKLTQAKLPSAITTIPVQTFWGCKALKSFDVEENITTISKQAFSKSGLQKITLPSTIQSIGKESFKNCPLETIKIKNGTIENIHAKAFDGAKSGIKFYVNTKAQAKTLKGALEKTNIKSAKIYANNTLVYKNVG